MSHGVFFVFVSGSAKVRLLEEGCGGESGNTHSRNFVDICSEKTFIPATLARKRCRPAKSVGLTRGTWATSHFENSLQAPSGPAPEPKARNGGGGGGGGGAADIDIASDESLSLRRRREG